MTVNLTTAPNMFFSQLLAVDNGDPVNPIGTHALSRSKRGVIDPQKVWPQFSTIRISIKHMTQEQRQFTKDNINKWAPHVNLEFEFTEQEDGDIRIKADNNLIGGRSSIGTSAKEADVDKHTMVIGFSGGLNEYNAGTVIHEFGHALGLKHEHQHPLHTLDINWQAISRDVQSGKVNVSLVNYIPLTTNVEFTAYDQKSVMHYGFPKEHLKSGEGIVDNNELSEGDKEIARRFYPKPEPKSPVHHLLPVIPFSGFFRAIFAHG
ncbi:M12 family metallopeptidase [Pseudomonas reactans]